MRYYKMVDANCIFAIGTGNNGEEVAAAEYNEILTILNNRPNAPEGYGYRLTVDLQWELYELPPAEEVEEDATEEDYLAALAELGVTDDEES